MNAHDARAGHWNHKDFCGLGSWQGDRRVSEKPPGFK